jgi:hypothetical protein
VAHAEAYGRGHRARIGAAHACGARGGEFRLLRREQRRVRPEQLARSHARSAETALLHLLCALRCAAGRGRWRQVQSKCVDTTVSELHADVACARALNARCHARIRALQQPVRRQHQPLRALRRRWRAAAMLTHHAAARARSHRATDRRRGLACDDLFLRFILRAVMCTINWSPS